MCSVHHSASPSIVMDEQMTGFVNPWVRLQHVDFGTCSVTLVDY